MSAVPLGQSAYRLASAGTPEVKIKNMFLAKDPTNAVDGLMRVQRPGLSPFANLTGAGGVRGMFKQEGVFGGDTLAAAGTKLDRVDDVGGVANLGTIDGTGRVQIVAGGVTGSGRGLIATGGNCWSTDGATVTQVTMPAAEPVQSVAYINGYFLLSQASTQRIYWIAPGETNPDALSFFSAEVTTDEILRLQVIQDQIWIFGQSSIEVWSPTGDADIPFSRIQGRFYNKGTLGRDTVVELDNTLFWVGDDATVYRASTTPQAISDEALTTRIQNVAREDLRAWRFVQSGHAFYVLRVGNEGTYCYDVTTQQWCEFTSFERAGGWRAHLGTQTFASLVIAGDEFNPALWTLTPGRSNDDGEPMVREITGIVSIIGQPSDCNNFGLAAAVGKTTEPGNPFVELNWSDDQGQTFPEYWRKLYLGAQGQYATEVVTWRLGDMIPPMRVFWLRYSDDSELRISYARINEASGYG